MLRATAASNRKTNVKWDYRRVPQASVVGKRRPGTELAKLFESLGMPGCQ